MICQNKVSTLAFLTNVIFFLTVRGAVSTILENVFGMGDHEHTIRFGFFKASFYVRKTFFLVDAQGRDLDRYDVIDYKVKTYKNKIPETLFKNIYVLDYVGKPLNIEAIVVDIIIRYKWTAKMTCYLCMWLDTKCYMLAIIDLADGKLGERYLGFKSLSENDVLEVNSRFRSTEGHEPEFYEFRIKNYLEKRIKDYKTYPYKNVYNLYLPRPCVDIEETRKLGLNFKSKESDEDYLKKLNIDSKLFLPGPNTSEGAGDHNVSVPYFIEK